MMIHSKMNSAATHHDVLFTLQGASILSCGGFACTDKELARELAFKLDLNHSPENMAAHYKELAKAKEVATTFNSSLSKRKMV